MIISKKEYFLVILILVLIGIDRTTKYLSIDKSFSIINYTKNTGALFGLFKGNMLILIILSIIILIFILYLLIFLEIKQKIALIFIFSGILSNLIDRIFYGYVTDFIDLKFWPVFNFADVFGIIGITMLIITMIKPQKT